MNQPFLAATAVVAISLLSSASHAQDPKAALESYFAESVAGLVTDPTIVAAIAARNAESGGLAQADIDALDATWKAEVGTADTPTISPVIAKPTADHLRSVVEASGGRITEVIVMDAMGLNVAITSVTSDMWQGDEAKFAETYGQGPGAVHYSEIELDESTGRYQAQISFTVADPATGQAIGAVAVGVDAESLM